MTLEIVNIIYFNCDLQTTNHHELVAEKLLLLIVNKHHCNLFTMCSFLNNLFTVNDNNNTMYSNNRIGNRN